MHLGAHVQRHLFACRRIFADELACRSLSATHRLHRDRVFAGGAGERVHVCLGLIYCANAYRTTGGTSYRNFCLCRERLGLSRGLDRNEYLGTGSSLAVSGRHEQSSKRCS